VTIREIQQRLAALGYKPGALDGVWGRQTQAAIRTFQRDQGLEPDGIIGPLTIAKLGSFEPTTAREIDSAAVPWFQEARRLVGTREHPGVGSNPEILDWSTEAGISYHDDDVPWCGLFVAHCIGSTLDREPLPTAVLRALAWKRFGIKTKPTLGAVMVFWRQSQSSGLGHVGFYAGESKERKSFRILGGNQSNSVSLAWIAADRLVDARWPATVSPPVPKPFEVAANEPLSWNEA
jgi:uncharacterized protein (TIGR02594 family)